jgi:DNA-directed RNA polymerase subunit H (RpoH/RPB5)
MSKETYDHDYNLLYKSFKTILSLLQRDGYNIDNNKDISLPELQSRIETNTINFMVEKDTGEKTYVIYHISKQLRPTHIQEYSEDIYQFREILKETDQLIIISKDKFNYTNVSGLSDTIETALIELYDEFKFYINIFPMSILQFNVLEHTLVPEHIKLSQDEIKTVKKKYNILDNSNFPTISRFDAVAKSIGLRPGEICKITRPSKISIDSIYFRLCI